MWPDLYVKIHVGQGSTACENATFGVEELLAMSLRPFEEEEKIGLLTCPPLQSVNDAPISDSSEVEGIPSCQQSSSKVVWALYGSHFLSAWGERMWEFAIGLVSRLAQTTAPATAFGFFRLGHVHLLCLNEQAKCTAREFLGKCTCRCCSDCSQIHSS